MYIEYGKVTAAYGFKSQLALDWQLQGANKVLAPIANAGVVPLPSQLSSMIIMLLVIYEGMYNQLDISAAIGLTRNKLYTNNSMPAILFVGFVGEV